MRNLETVPCSRVACGRRSSTALVGRSAFKCSFRRRSGGLSLSSGAESHLLPGRQTRLEVCSQKSRSPRITVTAWPDI
jgi:hypothetical protein